MTITSDEFRQRYGPTALVTGASSGIGEQLARALAERGLGLVLVARRRELLEGLAEALSQRYGIEAVAVAVDLARPDFLDELLPACAGMDIGLVVSNAGFGVKGRLHETPPEQLEGMLDVNCRAPLLLARAFAPRLLERGRGGFLVTASIEGYLGFPHSAAYAATKAFVRSLGEGIWQEYREQGLDVLVLSPGATDTEVFARLGMDPKALRAMAPEVVARQALGQLGRGPDFIPGFSNRLFVRVLRILPRRLALRIAGTNMRKALDAARPPEPADPAPAQESQPPRGEEP
ncbi:MAG: SDR family NAD(P)-dependent oxidoreductase [Deltaproteobacteria bacterium]|nr:SDR family NAD(P)-dependent oxidoreductase [Deltaproteobacteria bacterium]MBW2359625.1 SDR family NAD(P)-dependent oxidoreductase [Deltaproteobacteria bacterium]